MSDALDDEWEDELTLTQQVIQMADRAAGLTDDLSALVAWLVSFAPDDATKQLQFLTREGAAPLAALRELLARMGASEQPVPTIEGADGEPEARPSASLYRLVDQASRQVDELIALARWLLPFAPADGIREIEVMKTMSRSYRLALLAVQGLDMLLSHPWRSPREYVSGDLSMVAVLIDYRVEKDRGERQRLEEIKAQIFDVQRLEMQAAARRRVMQEAWGQLAYYEEGADAL